MDSLFSPSPPPPLPQSTAFNLENKVSPSVLLIIIIVAIVFFVSGLLHLLVRFLWTPPFQTHPQNPQNSTDFQGQLQHLFHLHDSGVDQSFIDTLPVFHYKSIIGSKSPFDCAVCLSEFEPEHKLRLLPKCSHAFHIECIDTWLLSHSTCPLCRSNLLPDHFSPIAPIVLVLESEDVDSTNSDVGIDGNAELENGSVEILKLEELNERVVNVKLGKFKNEENKNVDSRRCFSMGSFEYVMDEDSSLKVAIKSTKEQAISKPGYRAAMSECDCESRREFKLGGIEPLREVIGDENCNKIESFSISKIWLRGKNNRRDSSRGTVSFRFPMENGMEIDEGNQRRCSFDSELNQSFGKRTLNWIMGRQNRVSHFQSSLPSSSLSNV